MWYYKGYTFNSEDKLNDKIIPVSCELFPKKKMIAKFHVSKREFIQFENEYRILNSVSNRNIIKPIDKIRKDNCKILILERMDGDVFDLIEQGLNDKLTLSIILQTCNAIKYLHNRDIAHLDIKPENLLYNSNGDDVIVKLADFGDSIEMDSSNLVSREIGTLAYCAPEVLSPYNNYNGKKADIWSLGILLHVLYSGCWPYTGSSDYNVKKNIIEGNIFINDSIPSPIKQLISKMLSQNPSKRPDIEEVEDILNSYKYGCSSPRLSVKAVCSIENKKVNPFLNIVAKVCRRINKIKL